jgi:hypothetical protein
MQWDENRKARKFPWAVLGIAALILLIFYVVPALKTGRPNRSQKTRLIPLPLGPRFLLI